MYIADDSRYERTEYRYCGRSGLRLPAVSLGLWQNFGVLNDYAEMTETVLAAFDRGVTYFDLADNYGPPPGEAERNFGRILREELHAYRDEIVIATKSGYDMWPGPYGSFGSRKHMLADLDNSLRRLGLEYVDIFYHHRPDPDTPLEESMTALTDAVRAGKAVYPAVSNYPARLLVQAAGIVRDRGYQLIADQVRCNLLDRHILDDGLPEAAAAAGVGLTIFSPLEQGLLTDGAAGGTAGRRAATQPSLRKKLEDPATAAAIRSFAAEARAAGKSLNRYAVEWCLSIESVASVIVGARGKAQLIGNLG